jgi:hypothetical protein
MHISDGFVRCWSSSPPVGGGRRRQEEMVGRRIHVQEANLRSKRHRQMHGVERRIVVRKRWWRACGSALVATQQCEGLSTVVTWVGRGGGGVAWQQRGDGGSRLVVNAVVEVRFPRRSHVAG